MDPQERLKSIVDDNVDLDTGTFFLLGTIDYETVQSLHSALVAFAEMDLPRVNIAISSEGGEEAAGFAIYESLRMCPVPVDTYGFGSVMSIATLVLQAGDDRIITPECRLMVHGGTFEFGKGDVQQMHVFDLGKEMDTRTRQYSRIIAERSQKVTKEQVYQWCREGDAYFDAEEAVRLGLADGIRNYPPRYKRPHKKAMKGPTP